MIKVYYIHCGDSLGSAEKQAAMALLDESHRNKLVRYRRPIDFRCGLFGRLLLLAGLREHGFDQPTLPSFSFNAYDKPEPIDGLHFNISHSGEWVVCAMSADHDLGIDTEYMNPDLTWSDFDDIFTKDEWQQVGQNTANFYHLWTQKEAILKIAGTGFSVHPKEALLNDDIATLAGVQYRLLPLDIIPDHKTHLALPMGVPVQPMAVKAWGKELITQLHSNP